MQDQESHGKPIEEIVSGLQTHLERGLTQQEAQERLGKFGTNDLTERPRPGFFALLWDQFNNYLVIILIIAALISLALGEYVDSIAIMFIVVLNAVVGVIQESKAEQALAAPKKRRSDRAVITGRRSVGKFPNPRPRRQPKHCKQDLCLDRSSRDWGSSEVMAALRWMRQVASSTRSR